VFTPSSLVASAAAAVVAQTAGAGSDAESLTLATRSLDAAAMRWNRLKWKFLYTEQYIALAAPFTVTGCSVTAGSTTLTTTVASGFASVLVDDLIVDANSLAGEVLVAAGTGTASTAVTMLAPALTTTSGMSITFRRPLYAIASNVKSVYDLRLGGTAFVRPLFYIQRRSYDRRIIDQVSGSTPVAYDLFLQSDRGKLRVIPPPDAAYTLLFRYHRRITLPSLNATATLDIPQDYEDVFLACAKANFLTDKKDDGDRRAYWDRYAREGLAQMRSDEAYLADEILTFEPPSYGVYTNFDPGTYPQWEWGTW